MLCVGGNIFFSVQIDDNREENYTAQVFITVNGIEIVVKSMLLATNTQRKREPAE